MDAVFLGKMDQIPLVGLWGIALVLIFGQGLYNIYFHPAKDFPGPYLAKATRLYYSYYRSTGQLEFKTKELHDKYGQVVRLAPDELSFNGGTAWDDIYGFKTKKSSGKNLMKDPHFYIGATAPNGEKNLGASGDLDHARIRGVLSYAFSDKALYSQEVTLISHIDHLIRRLHALNGQATDGVRWLHHCTYDIITDLALGQSANTLACDTWSPQAHLIFDSIKEGIVFVEILRFLPFKNYILTFFMKMFGTVMRQNFDQAVERARKRMETQDINKPDFISYILRANESARALTSKEITANTALLLDAGSETTASLLSGCLFYLAKNPDVLSKLSQVIRERFAQEDEMDSKSLAQLPYLTAVLNESLRIYPSVASSTPRLTPPGGSKIDNRFVPGNIIVAVNQYAAYRSEDNFADPYSFIPERWLSGNDDKRFVNDRPSVLQPFSIGPRNCLGRNLAWLEMRLILGRLLWNFDLELTEESQNWHAVQKTWFIWDKPDLMMRFKARQTLPIISSE
ncbi:hypothetical protein ZTR_07491 [Talaromyces verruculosus]|nr:hypothetical protein ZTR_07491 [Talaromyces verruculosus]